MDECSQVSSGNTYLINACRVFVGVLDIYSLLRTPTDTLYIKFLAVSPPRLSLASHGVNNGEDIGCCGTETEILGNSCSIFRAYFPRGIVLRRIPLPRMGCNIQVIPLLGVHLKLPITCTF